ncbi:nitrate/sulfonate/bicarbonate ABC transporter ATP-binding protein [Desulfurobacterium indicum]|uniref:Nitrate ABC transporter ATP-binding protein n=1 Tax=Desulfurobacterium indicum TaxID=1914305 RepID=A0A1R1MM22_9BACT|nr:nitrate/sulfonate/bicarbonate ABC transporter ATP-binding protein [Desulfurobacterium indicum]OMH40780.1 nitrate ABC transporter ATP-binding protein [Desulfurobacterium indicum]
MEKQKEKRVLVDLKNISHMYKGREKSFYALKNINLKLYEDEFVCLVGASGSGKSTLLRIITGLQKPTEGEVLYKGKPLKGVNPDATIVFQTFALFPWLTVLENVEIALKARGIPKKIRVPIALELIDRVGLDGFETAYPRELSGGMRQKVGIARAIALEPELLCLDEPFSALDVLSAEAIRGELLELWIEGKLPTKTILMVTHNIEEAVFMADRIVVMDKNPGRIIAELEVNLPHPRDRKSQEFINIVDKVYSILAGKVVEELHTFAQAKKPGKFILPDVDISDLIGLIEYLDEKAEKRYDIYKLADELNIGSEKLLNLIEAAELLKFVEVKDGDVILTPLGETFSQASILVRKEMFAVAVKKLPIFQWLINILKSADNKALKWDVLVASLSLEMPEEEAERQLEILIKWGRYAEIIAYDDENELIILENG